MRKFCTFLLTTVLAMLSMNAFAIDKPVFKVGDEYTSVEDLVGKSFAIVNKAESKALYGPNNQNLGYDVFSKAFAATNSGYTWQLESLDEEADEKVHGCYLIHLVRPDGTPVPTSDWSGKYLNSQGPTGWCCFNLGISAYKYGQDIDYGAVWEVEYVEDQGFSLKNVGTQLYKGANTGTANAEAPFYFAFLPIVGYDAEEVAAIAVEVEAALKTTDAKTAYGAAKAAYEADPEAAGALDTYVAAINAAIDVIDMCENINNTYAGYGLSSVGKAAVKEVLTKYNAGEYQNASALMTAYVAAAKTQNSDGADMTGAIFNPSFELGTKEGWTSNDCGDVAGNLNFAGRTGNKFCEKWTGSANKLTDGKFYQELTGLPNGTYKVTADLQNREQGNGDAAGTGFFVYANEDRTEGLEANDGKTIEVTTEVADGNLTLGVQLDGCSGNWVCFDNFTLTLVKAANPTIPEKEEWFENNLFCYKDKTINMVDRDTEVTWAADPDDDLNGCIKVVAGIKAGAETQDDHSTQFWIRGAEVEDANDLSKGAFAKGTGFKVTFKVKADGEYEVLPGYYRSKAGSTTAKNDKNAWNHISYFAENLKVTTEWQTVSYICISPDDLFTSFGLNLADKTNQTVRTFYFDDVKIEGRGGSEWYLNNEFHAKDYKNGDETYSDGSNPHPVARYVADAEGGYVEVVSNAGASQTYNSQLWIAIPEEYVGSFTTMTMEVQASKVIKTPESFQATATGNGWGCNPGPGSGVDFTVANEWIPITRILNTKGVKSTGTWSGLQADQYCLDLSDVSDAKEAVVYKFRNVKFDKAAEDWYNNNNITVDGEKAPYIYGTGEEGGYVEVAGGKSLVFGIPTNLQGGDVKISMKVKAAAEDASTDITYTTAWADAEIIVEAAEATYTLALPAEGTFDFDEVAFEKYYKPIDYGALIEIPVEGTLVKEVDYTTVTSYTHSPGWAQNKEGYTDKLIVGEGLEIVNNADQGMWESQFFILENAPLVAGNDYAVRYTLKYDGEGGDMQINLQAGDWSTNNQAVYPLAAGPIYTQMVHIAKGWTGNGNANVFFQSGAIKGRMIVEKVEVFDVTPKYDEMAWTDNILVNGNLEGEDMSEFVGKIVKGEYIYEGGSIEPTGFEYTDLDPETLLLEAVDYYEEWDQEAANSEVGGTKGLMIDVAEWPEGEGNDYDSQLFVRLPKALPKGTIFKLSFDYAGANSATSSVIAAHAEPGQWQANFSKTIKPADDWEWTHFEEYLTAPEDMRSIAFNLGSKDGGVFIFDNFSVQYDAAKATDVEELTATWDMNWAETLALNEKIHEAKGYDNEEGQYTEESFSALQTAITDAKTVAKNAEAAKDDIVAATSDVQDAIDGLKAPEVFVALPELSDEYEAIPLSQEDYGSFSKAAVSSGEYNGDAYTVYTASDQIQGAFKMKNVDVTGCDKIYIYFAQPVKQGWEKAFWGIEGPDGVKSVDAGTTCIEFDLTEDLNGTGATYEDNGKTILKEVTLMTLWGASEFPLEAKVYGAWKHKVAPELSYTDLTQDMFFQWSDWTDADPVANAGCAYDVNVESGQPYGDSNVINYADLSEYATLEVTTPAGTAVQPRFLFNRDVNEGQDNEVEEESHLIDMPKFAWSEKYQSVKENVDGSKTYVIDIAAIVADKGYAHLHAIKALGWGNSTTVTDMKLGYYGEKPSIPIPTAINAVAEGGEGAALKDGKYFVDGQTIIVKNGKKYTVAGVEIK